MHFRVPVSELESLSTRTFVEADDAWRSFTLHHRSSKDLHEYDVVEGPMVGNVENLRRGGRGRPWGNQVSFHTSFAASVLNRFIQ